MCSYIVEQADLCGSAKGSGRWQRIDTATVYYDHPYHSSLDHALCMDFTCRSEGSERVALELSAESARALVAAILRTLERGEAEHRYAPHGRQYAEVARQL